MSHYAPLFRMTLGHEYFDGGVCETLDVELDAASSALAHRAGLIVKSQPGEVAVLYDRDRMDALALYAADLEEPFALVFQATSQDARFANYTELGPRRDGFVLGFDTRESAHPSEDGSLRLSREPHVSSSDLVALDEPDPLFTLSPRGRQLPPIALVRIHLADSEGELIEVDGEGHGPVYHLGFRARETYWKYLLLGTLADRDASIVDPDDESVFEFIGEATLPGNRTATAFRSASTIPFRQRSDLRLQLRARSTNGDNGGRVLIKRLPVASPDHIHRESIQGEEALVSDIYLNG